MCLWFLSPGLSFGDLFESFSDVHEGSLKGFSALGIVLRKIVNSEADAFN